MTIEIKESNPYESIYWPIRTVIFYLFFLLLWRLVFVNTNEVPLFWEAQRHGFKLDLSMACGVLLTSFIPWALYLITGWEWLRKTILAWNILIWTCICLIEYSSILMYRDWGGTLDARAISYLVYPREAWASSKSFFALWPSVLSLILFVSGLKRLTLHYDQWQPVKRYYLQSWIFIVLVGPCAFLGLRGGAGKWPLTPSDGFYSTDNHQNFAAVNKTWYLLYSLVKTNNYSIKSDDALIDKFTDQYHQTQICHDSTLVRLAGKNIVLIVAEGWSEDMVQYLKGDGETTPFFDSLSNHSLKYTQMFASGFRTDQGVPALLSGVPSIGGENMLNQMKKARQFPSLAKLLKSKGYTSSFVYGGDLNFANMRNYIVYQGFENIIGKTDFESDDVITEWGVPDHIVASRAIQICEDVNKQQKGPFFTTVLLLSSHTPFEVPVPNDIKGIDIPSKYKASVKYSDYAMSVFFQLAKSKSWFENTVFIITTDHGSSHTGLANNSEQRFRIPFIVYNYQTESLSSSLDVSTVSNQFDLPFSIAKSINSDPSDFSFGRDLWCVTDKRTAFFSNDIYQGCKGETKGDAAQTTTLFYDMVRTWFNKLDK